MKTMAERYVQVRKQHGNDRMHRTYWLTRRYSQRHGETYLKATWIGGHRHTTYHLVEVFPPKCMHESFPTYGRTIGAGYKTLAEVREAAYAYLYKATADVA